MRRRLSWPHALRRALCGWRTWGGCDTHPPTGKPLGLTGLVRKYQPDAVTTLRSGWMGDDWR
ncbi:hypothetical protein [Streptomyces sp. NPDC050759]|uniref:hypothetical protein n=1 Tax=Streptomyces sp. NPDC050759 TaxID=3365635 RepID=UPI0037BA4D43